ncbi:MAG TPA: mechanosensitive ion channel domain-containing protein [Myxococcaceae bacterium]|nr:mechanosensitive ion channel domain-containing protein [Myxococcaceae bacterium]
MKSRPAALALVLLVATTAAGAEPDERPGSPPPGEVRIRERAVLELRAPLAGRPPQLRGREATEALVHVLEQPGPDVVRLEPREQGVALLVGSAPILELAPDDAREAGASDLTLYAAAAGQRVEAALKAERRRLEIQDSVFSVSLAVFITLLAFLALRLVGRLGSQLRAALLADRERIPALRLGTVEVASRRVVRGALRLGLLLGTRIVQIVVLYVWLLFVLSLFAATRAYGTRLTGSVLRPAGAILGRAGAALPMLVVAALFALLVALVVRTLRLFFESVARGETHVRWIPADLATPVGVLLRGAIVVLAVLFAAPLITGGDTGALSRLATAVLLALGLGAVPLLASVAAGLPTVLGRRLRPGEMVEVGGRQGQVREVTLLEVRLEDAEGAELRIPHLVAFLHPSRGLGGVPRRALEVCVRAAEDQARVESVLLEAAGSHASGARAELLSLDAGGARWRVSGIHPDLGQRVATALRDASIVLGQPGPEAGG